MNLTLKTSPYKKAFNTLNAIIWPVLALTAATSVSLVKIFFPVPAAWQIYLIWPDILLKTALELIVTAFIYGFLIDLATGREYLQNKTAFLKNLKTFLTISFLAILLPVPVHFLIFVIFGPGMPFALVKTGLAPFILLLWLYSVFKNKFPDVRFTTRTGLTWMLLSIVYYGIAMFFVVLPQGSSLLKHAGVFSLEYLHLWTFLVLGCQLINDLKLNTEKTDAPPEIYLVNPLWGGTILWVISMLLPRYPFIFVILKALTPERYTFKEFNQVLWHDHYYRSGKLVAITCFTSNCIEAYKIASEFRKKGSRVIMGGPHVTAFPEEALEFCDAVVVGPVENIWERVIEDYEAGRLQGVYTAAPKEETYRKTSDFLLTQAPEVIADCMETTRGCKFNCHFCGGGHAKTGYHKNTSAAVIANILKLKSSGRQIFFLDDNIYSDPAYARELFEQLKPLHIRWSGSSTLDIAKDSETLQLCKESGCSHLLIGYEIFPGSRETRAGKFAMADDYIRLSRIIEKQGITIKAHFIYGFESDDFKTFWRLWWFALRLFPLISSLSILTPVPNSRFYQDIDREDRFINLNWSKYNLFNLVHQHPSINNPLFRHASFLVTGFFTLTTSKLGLGLVGIAAIYTACALLF